MTIKQIKILTISLNLLVVLYYWFSFSPYCYLFGGSCNAGVLAVFLLPAFLIIETLSIISIVLIFRNKNLDKKSKLPTILLSICLLVTVFLASTATMDPHLLTKTILFYLPLFIMINSYLVINYLKIK